MTATNHVITGALIAAALKNPVMALPASFLSHFIMDALPHFGRAKVAQKSSRQFMFILGGDCLTAGLILLLIAITQPAGWMLLFACGVLAASPDLMWFPNYARVLKKIPEKPNNLIMKFHSWIQWGERPWGILVEAAWFIAVVWALFYFEQPFA